MGRKIPCGIRREDSNNWCVPYGGLRLQTVVERMGVTPRVLWKVRNQDTGAGENLARALGVHPITGCILINRGINSSEAGYRFLYPQLSGLYDPLLMDGMQQAVARIEAAVADGEKITIYGDYDVDGLSGTAILVDALRRLGARVAHYLPRRLEEGYGLNSEAVRRIAADGTSLLITVDCGVTAVAEADLARALGMDVVITDHHEAPEQLPQAVAVLNPKKPCVSPYPFSELAGAGVALKLTQALLGNSNDISEFLGLAALGTIADIVPLVDENRIIASFGLQAIVRSRRPGLEALLAVVGRGEGREVSAGDIGFRLGPGLNAAGRLSDARQALELLLTRDPDRGQELAKELDARNRKRQDIERMILEGVKEELPRQWEVRQKVVVLAREDWHPGVVGIAASRLQEAIHRPVILIGGGKDGQGRGSARSIPGFDMHRALGACADLLVEYGGHEMAAGLTIQPANVDAFRQQINDWADNVLDADLLVREVPADIRVSLDKLSPDLVDELELLAPFGIGNPRPALWSQARLVSLRRVGEDGTHLQLQLEHSQTGTRFRGIAFGKGNLCDMLSAHLMSTIDILYEPVVNRWQGRTDLEVKIREIQFEAAETPADVSSCLRFSFSHVQRLGEKCCLVVGGNGKESIAPDDSHSICAVEDRRGQAGKISYIIGLLEKGSTGILIYINRPQQAIYLSQRLPAFWRERKGCAFFSPGLASDRARKLSALFKAGRLPLAMAIGGGTEVGRVEGVKQVVLYDPPLHRGAVLPLLSTPAPAEDGIVLHLLYGYDDVKAVSRLLRLVFPSDDVLRIIYKALVGAYGYGKTFSPDYDRLRRYIQEKWGARVIWQGLGFAIEVFSDLGLVTKNSKDTGELSMRRVQRKVDLSTSVRYNEYRRIVRDYVSMQEHLISMSAGDLLWTILHTSEGDHRQVVG